MSYYESAVFFVLWYWRFSEIRDNKNEWKSTTLGINICFPDNLGSDKVYFVTSTKTLYRFSFKYHHSVDSSPSFSDNLPQKLQHSPFSLTKKWAQRSVIRVCRWCSSVVSDRLGDASSSDFRRKSERKFHVLTRYCVYYITPIWRLLRKYRLLWGNVVDLRGWVSSASGRLMRKVV